MTEKSSIRSRHKWFLSIDIKMFTSPFCPMLSCRWQECLVKAFANSRNLRHEIKHFCVIHTDRHHPNVKIAMCQCTQWYCTTKRCTLCLPVPTHTCADEHILSRWSPPPLLAEILIWEVIPDAFRCWHLSGEECFLGRTETAMGCPVSVQTCPCYTAHPCTSVLPFLRWDALESHLGSCLGFC